MSIARVRRVPGKKSWAIGALVVGLLAVGVYLATRPAAPTGVAAAPASPPVRSSRVVAEAKVVPVRSANLAFPTGGLVVQVLVAEGDRVEAGQPLARLDATRQQVAVAQAEAGLRGAQARLDELRAGARPEEVDAAQAAIDAATAKLSSVQIAARPEDVASAQAEVDSAKARLEQAKAPATTVEIRAAEQEVSAAQAQLSKAKADQSRLKAGATSQDVKNAELQVTKARNDLRAAQADRDTVCKSTGSASDQCASANAKVASAQNAVSIAQNNLAKLKAGPTSSDLSAAQGAVNAAQAQLTAAQAKLSQEKAGPRAEDIQIAQAALTQAEQALALTRKPYTDADVQQAQAELRKAQAELKLLSAGARPQAITAAEADVAAAQATVDQARSALADAELKAPFPGLVGAVEAKAGEQVAAGAPVMRLGDVSSWQLETTDLTELGAVADSREGQVATATFDALPGHELAGTVARVRAFGEAKQGDVVYTAIVTPERYDEQLRWNMTASVAIAPGE